MGTGADESGKAALAAPLSKWALPTALALLAAGVLAFLYVLLAASSKPEPRDFARFAVGPMRPLVVREAPPAQPVRPITNDAGGQTTLTEFRGQYVLVNLWATWCVPCMDELPTIAAVARRYDGRLKVVTINFDPEADLPNAKKTLLDLGGGALPFLTDPSRRIMFDVDAKTMPTTILYDPEGRELARVGRGVDWASPEAEAFLDAAIEGRT